MDGAMKTKRKVFSGKKDNSAKTRQDETRRDEIIKSKKGQHQLEIFYGLEASVGYV
jgi:hypothetical protein